MFFHKVDLNSNLLDQTTLCTYKLNINKTNEQMKIIEEELVPFGIINDGNDPDEFQIPGDNNVWSPAKEPGQFEYY